MKRILMEQIEDSGEDEEKNEEKDLVDVFDASGINNSDSEAGEGEGGAESSEPEADKAEDSSDEQEQGDEACFNCLCDVIKHYSDGEPTIDKLKELLNIAVTDELLATYNYMAAKALAKTEGRSDFIDEFEAHEKEEYDHAHQLIDRIREMQGTPLQTPWAKMPCMNSNGTKWAQEFSNDSSEILLNRYYEELGAIKFYGFILEYLHELKKAGEYDSTTHTIIKKIKADEEEHALDLRDLLDEYGIEHDDEAAMKCGDGDDEEAPAEEDDVKDELDDIPDDDEEDDDDEDLGDDIPETDTDEDEEDDFESDDEDEEK